MIPRVLEPEVMNDPLQVDAYAAADFNVSDQAVVDRIEQLLAVDGVHFRQQACLVDLGCGPGNISLRLAKRWTDCCVLGVDAAERMLRVAEARRRDAGVMTERLRYQRRALPLPASSLEADLVVSNSLLHHLHDPMHLWSSVKSLASSRCLVLHRDLKRPDSEASIDGLCQQHVANAPEVLQRDYRASLRAAFTAAEVKAQLAVAGLPQLQVMEVEDRYLEVSGWITGCQAGVDQRSP
ncbi:methyltransferase domain protein [Synechococcus sp. A15-60]|nr:methyltransferase domain protein [Synechococcus sp. A15-60]